MKRALAFSFGAFWLLLWLGIGEIAAGWWVRSNGDALDRTRAVVWADASLGWRQRPNLDVIFEGKVVRTNELGLRAPAMGEARAMRRLVLGPSSAFGWGIALEEAYAARLGAVNAGQIGFSSFQGLKLIDEPWVKELNPEVILLAYGVNDLDRHRFFFQSAQPDSTALAGEQNPGKVKLYRLLARSSLLAVLYRVANNVRAAMAYGNLGDIPAQPVPTLRVPPEDFERTYRALISKAKALGARVVVLGTPVHMPSPDGKAASEAERLHADGLALYRAKKLHEALEVFQKALAVNPYRNEVYYYLAAISSALARPKEAKSYLAKARQTEPYRVHRDVLAYNEVLKRIAAEESVTFVDLNRIFEGKDKAPLFVDPVHPSAEGHRMIAEEIFAKAFAPASPQGTKKGERR